MSPDELSMTTTSRARDSPLRAARRGPDAGRLVADGVNHGRDAGQLTRGDGDVAERRPIDAALATRLEAGAGDGHELQQAPRRNRRGQHEDDDRHRAHQRRPAVSPDAGVSPRWLLRPLTWRTSAAASVRRIRQPSPAREAWALS